ncbi:MAG: NAD(P)-binding protein [Gammaproteobacteria bacterium]|nr:NAD(P)-binding protein [Gammaproteobacteria bacterium]
MTTAAYLAKAGLRVRIFERRRVIGGAAITEAFHPGFSNSVYSCAISLLQPQIIQDLDLERHGLEILEKPAGTLSLLADDHLQLTRDSAQIKREVARFSQRDAERVEAFDSEIARVALALRSIARSAPPDIGRGWSELPRLLQAGNALRKLETRDQSVLAELMTKSLGDYLVHSYCATRGA